MTGGAEINFGWAREVYLCEFERGTGAREIYPSLDQMNKVKIQRDKNKETEDSEGFSGRNQKFKLFFRPKSGDLQKKKVFIRTMSCKLRKYENFGLDLHPSSPKPVNFFGAQSSLGGHNFRLGAQEVIWGGTAPVCPPWRRVCNKHTKTQHKH